MSEKVKFALYLPPEKKAELERRYREDGCRSITAFIEKAIDFYQAISMSTALEPISPKRSNLSLMAGWEYLRTGWQSSSTS